MGLSVSEADGMESHYSRMYHDDPWTGSTGLHGMVWAGKQLDMARADEADRAAEMDRARFEDEERYRLIDMPLLSPRFEGDRG
ncbi:MAG: hypothetical protein Q8P57_01865 [Candidatus Pacearchaeota archaeon]|nr:hypothetical protein [Candidatus Pacearchaeota archaeon]